MVQKQRRVFLDENMPNQIAHSLHVIQSHLNNKETLKIEVTSIIDVFGRACEDEVWIPKVGSEKGIVITFDQMIQRNRYQRELYIKFGVGMFFLHMPKTGMNFWTQFNHLIDCWPEIKGIIQENKTPFAYRQMGLGKKFEEWKREDK
jgi:PIN like domain